MSTQAGRLDGLVAVVTGASQGIGRAVAGALAAEGTRLAVAGRNRLGLEQVAAACYTEVLVVDLDVTDEGQCQRAVRSCEEHFGRVDVLVNCAGIAKTAPFTKTTTEVWRQTMAVDVEGPFWLTRAALPGMLARGSGRVIGVASVAARVGFSHAAAYTAAKHALLGMTRALASEYARSGVTFNCVCPFYVDTPMLAAAVDSLVADAGLSRSRASAALMSPQGRYILVDEVAAACVWLASPDGRSVNGQAINIDGGRVQS